MPERTPILFVFASRFEAAGLIEALGLKHHPGPGRFPIYRSDDRPVSAVITGSSKVSAATGAALALREHGAGPRAPVHLVNLGAAAAAGTFAAAGEAFLANRIHDVDTGFDYYPDLLARHPFREAGIASGSRMVTPEDFAAHPEWELAEMEAAGIFQAAVRFVTTGHVHFIKVVSDYGVKAWNELDIPASMEHLDALRPAVLDYVEGLQQLPDPAAPPLTEADIRLLEAAARFGRLTTTQSHRLYDYAAGTAIRGAALAPLLEPHLDRPRPNAKQERASWFKSVCHALLES